MSDDLLPGHELNHVGYIVANLEPSRHEWAARLGTDPAPIFTSPPYAEAQTLYCGSPTEARVRQMIMLGAGGIGIELLEPIGRPSAWADWLDQGGEGQIHHIAYWVDDLRAAIALHEARGAAVIQTGQFTGGRDGKDGEYAYVRRGGPTETTFELMADR